MYSDRTCISGVRHSTGLAASWRYSNCPVRSTVTTDDGGIAAIWNFRNSVLARCDNIYIPADDISGINLKAERKWVCITADHDFIYCQSSSCWSFKSICDGTGSVQVGWDVHISLGIAV